MTKEPTYIGDGVYCIEIEEEDRLVVYTSNGVIITNEIIISRRLLSVSGSNLKRRANE